MQEFLEDDSSISDAFEDAFDNPFDDIQSVEDIVKDMQETYNTDEARKREAERKRKATFREKYGVGSKSYDKITDLFGSDIWQRLHEIYQYDSSDFLDLILELPSNLTSADIEIAMQMLWKDLASYGGSASLLDEDSIIEALELGFSLEEAIYLTQSERQFVPIDRQNIGAAVSDYIKSMMIQQEMERQARETLRNRYADSVRGRV